MTKQITRRSFLKFGGAGAVAATVAVVPRLDFERVPNEGDRVQLWGGRNAVCTGCDNSLVVTNVLAVYSGKDDDGDHIFLLEQPYYCNSCRRKVGFYIGPIDKFTKTSNGI